MNPGVQSFGVFLAASVLLALTPGQDTLFVLGRSLAGGVRAGIASVAGILSGAVVHVLAGAAGLSALMIASREAFVAVKLAGGAYLVYLGSRSLFGKNPEPEISRRFAAEDFIPIWKQGLLTNLLNPKVALFILAFIPQFIDERAPSKFAAFVFLGACFFTIGTAWLLCVVFFSSALAERLRGDARWMTILNRAAGGLFVILGLRLLLAK